MLPDFEHLSRSESTNPESFLDKLDIIRTGYQEALKKDQQAEMGQFFTRPKIARLMASLFTQLPNEVNLLDPGAGVGSLSAAFIVNAIQVNPRPNQINITSFELDPSLVKGLRITLEYCHQLCNQYHIKLNYEVHQEDFIKSSVDFLLSQNSLFSMTLPDYNCAILNPPYKKLNSDSISRKLLSSVGIETTNLYSAFMWLTMNLLPQDGKMVAIVPRSFCNGAYYRPFRSALLHDMTVKRIHLYEARDKSFEEAGVLQENIILSLEKTPAHEQVIVITSSDNPEDEDIITREIEYSQLVHPEDPDFFIRIVPDHLGSQINTQINTLSSTLEDLGLSVSTGRVVDFRSKEFLRNRPDEEIIPLIYPGNLRNGKVVWPLEKIKKPSYLATFKGIETLVIPSEYYVLVKRFSSKEEKRRIFTAIYDPSKIVAKRIGLENHINYYHRRYGRISEEIAKGLNLYLNSSLVDQYFRQFSGHTQVNAGDLRKLKYPSESQLINLSRRIGEEFPDQDEIDKIITEELALNGINHTNGNDDPIQAKKKIKEALNILKLLNVPRAQQNDRSALTLLSLANVQASTQWKDASEHLIGITEMMTFFREHYGISYAPNTRETVRRFTIHQFLQLGLAIANPDDPARPINSPKTRYIITPKTLDLIKTFRTQDWEFQVGEYIRRSPLLSNLQVRERALPMIPVTLPGGESIMLSSGGQNNLIKQIVEEFCPRFSPGGEVVYIGDAGGKVNEKEIKYFDQLGIKLDKHGKMPDLIISLPEKKWLILVEAVTSHGPIDIKRYNELKALFRGSDLSLIYVTAFETRRIMNKYLSEIAWETEVWVSETPSHLIHFNGEKFLGPYS